MAKNRVYEQGRRLNLPVAAGTLSGDPVAVGQIVGVAQYDRDADGNAVVDRRGVYRLAVNAVDGGGNSAVAVGDRVYFTQADATKLSKKNAGVSFGFALEAIAAGTIATIDVAIGA